ncbi:MAG: DUF2794 domain-containing protein [Methylocella sp.]
MAAASAGIAVISFDRIELREIFSLYGRKVAGGEWRDYGIDFIPQKSGFFGLPAPANIRSTGSRGMQG